MNLFKKNKPASVTKSEVLFQEVVKETNELYEDLMAECETVETVVNELIEFINGINNKLSETEKIEIEEFVNKLNKVNAYAVKSRRDVRDLLRSQRKVLSELRREN